jgi:hypothetical protein
MPASAVIEIPVSFHNVLLSSVAALLLWTSYLTGPRRFCYDYATAACNIPAVPFGYFLFIALFRNHLTKYGIERGQYC